MQPLIGRRKRLMRDFSARERMDPGFPPRPENGPDISLYVNEAVTRQMVEYIIEEVREVHNRTMTLLFVIIGGIFVDIVMRWLGG